jgi:hypothetical protein
MIKAFKRINEWRVNMKIARIAFLALIFMISLSGRALANNAAIMKEIQALKERIEELEEKLEEQEALAKRQAAKTENSIEDNEKRQFVGKAFVNNTVLDSESEYTPLIGAEFKPTELLAFSVVGTSTSRPNVEGTPLEDTAKSKYDNVFSLELYYRIAVTENLAFTPDLQYVWNPGADSSNDPIFAGMVCGEFNF